MPAGKNRPAGFRFFAGYTVRRSAFPAFHPVSSPLADGHPEALQSWHEMENCRFNRVFCLRGIQKNPPQSSGGFLLINDLLKHGNEIIQIVELDIAG